VQAARGQESALPWRLLRWPCVWAIVVAHVGTNYAWYVVLSWMPTFFVQAHGLDLAENTYILATPYIAGFVGLLLAGRVSDACILRGCRVRHVRKAAQLVGAVGCTVFLQLAARAGTAGWAAAWMAVSLFFGQMQSCGYWINMVDLCPETAAKLMGLSNTVATIPGIVGQPITQAILDASESWAAVFGVGGVIAIVAAVVFLALGDDAPIDVPHHMPSDASAAGSEDSSAREVRGKPPAPAG